MDNSQPDVRVRFAPSPTGYLHIGGARTAIFNWLFARKNNGKFFLRIEDTDVVRSSQEVVDAIFESLKWLGLNWDDEPRYQSQRFDVYRRIAEELVQKRKAYHCYCGQEDDPEDNAGEGERNKCQCYLLTVKEKEALDRRGNPRAIRFWVPDGTTIIDDQVYGSMEFNNSEIENFVILRSDKIPTYHLAVVVDDHDMGITHIIRGEDHISNTPKHILLYHALGWEPPKYAHVPLILGEDKKRLSKRHGATSVMEYMDMGILPDAMVNYLALLGWSPGDDREIFRIPELIEAFSINGISRKSAVFDPKKLEWVNSEHLKIYPTEELLQWVLPSLRESHLITDFDAERKVPYLIRVLDLFKNRMKTTKDLAKYGRYFFKDPERYDEKALQRYWEGAETKDRLQRLKDRLNAQEEFTADKIEEVTRTLASELGVSAAKLIHPMRILLTGFSVSPGLFEMMEVLGRDTCLRRVERGLKIL